MPRINEPCHPPRRHANTEIDEQGILSSRSLLIMTISAATALLAGASAGISAAVALPASIGVAGRVALGILAALGTGIVIGLTIAGTLNGLVNRS
jgi:hypothetical protein